MSLPAARARTQTRYPAHAKPTRVKISEFWRCVTQCGSRATDGNTLRRAAPWADPKEIYGFCKQMQLVLFSRTELGEEMFGIRGTGSGLNSEREMLVRTAVARFVEIASKESRKLNYGNLHPTYDDFAVAHNLKPDSFCLWEGFQAAVLSDAFFEIRHEMVNRKREDQGLAALPLPRTNDDSDSEGLACDLASPVPPPGAVQPKPKPMQQPREAPASERSLSALGQMLLREFCRAREAARGGELEFDVRGVSSWYDDGSFRVYVKRRARGSSSGQVDAYLQICGRRHRVLRSEPEIRKHFEKSHE